MSLDSMDLDALCVNTIRTLSIDMVHRANSGHPGAPLGCAAIMHALFDRHMKFNPADPEWPDRDRFVLSAGHASALLYATLHINGYDVPMAELENFRQFESMTPGHPEADCAPGVEVATGPLGQGLGDSVGMAIAERYLATSFNAEGHEIVDHYTYVLASDGDMMEGISHEAGSLAGFLKLGRLIVLYDDNDISLEGPTEGWFADDTGQRFESYGWHVQRVEDATTDLDAISQAIDAARGVTDKPSLIICKTHIGYASPVQDTGDAHGKPLDADQMKETKKALGWPEDSSFLVPEKVRERTKDMIEKGRQAQADWDGAFAAWAEAQPEKAEEWERSWTGRLPAGWDEGLPSWTPDDGSLATRNAAGAVLEVLRNNVPSLIGGCADLGSSTKTLPKDGKSMMPGDYAPQNIRFGVREHAMAAACNGIARHGGLRAYGSTFLVFSDYARPSLRLAGLMQAPVVYQFTHDSVGLGEDGPTHQPIEHLASLRAIPHWTVIRPADANEAREAWRAALLNGRGPTALACSRQGLPVLDREKFAPAENLHKGAYVLQDPAEGDPDVILMASGSEVSVALEAAEALAEQGVKARVVSFPSWELFEAQSQDYRDSVLLPAVERRVVVEAASPFGWERYAGPAGIVIGLNRFGASAPGAEVLTELGITAEAVVSAVKELVKQ